MQTLGGMSGAIIVEDPKGTVPDAIQVMREVVVILQETNLKSGNSVMQRLAVGRC